MKTFDEVWVSRLTREQIKPGVTVYPVFSTTGSSVHIMDAQVISSEIYTDPVLNEEFFTTNNSVVVVTANNIVGEKQTTFCAMFTDEKDARDYAGYIQRDEMPEDFKEIRRILVERQQELRELSNNDWW